MSAPDPALALLEEHRSLVFHLIGLHAGNGCEADDAYQEIYLQVRRAYPSFRGDSKPSTWLYRVVLNTLLQMHRSAQRRPVTQSWEDAGAGAAAEAASVPDETSRDAAQRLSAALARLPVVEQTLIGLHLEGFDYEEIGQMFGLEAGTVGVRLHRIKKKLQIWLISPHG